MRAKEESVPRRLCRLLDYAPLDMTDLLDFDLHDVADLEISRRLHRDRDAARRAGRNDRAGQQREHRRQRLDAGEAVENEMLRVRMLPLLAVDPRMQFERMRVRNLVRRYDPRPDRPVRIERLAERHRLRAPLPIARADVVYDRVSRDHLARLVARHMAASLSDHESHLALVIERLRVARRMNRVVRSVDTTRLLVEEDRKVRLVAARLRDMVGVIQSDRQKLGRPHNRRFELDLLERDPVAALTRRLARALHSGVALAEERCHFARQLRRRSRQIDDIVVHDDSDSSRTTVTERNELHLSYP